MNKKLILMSFWAFTLCANAQQVTNGQVTDKAGNPISGARVEAKGTSFHTITGIDGRFALETPMLVNKVRVSSPGKVTRSVDVTPNMVVVMKHAGFWNSKPSKYQFFVSPQLTIPGPKFTDFPIGVMAGVVKNVGIYGRFVTSGLPSYDSEFTSYAGAFWIDRKMRYQAITGGLIFRVCGPVYLSLGLGYVQRIMVKQHLTGKWYKIGDDSYSGLGPELGVMIRFGHIIVNAGATGFVGEESTMRFSPNIGVGYVF